MIVARTKVPRAIQAHLTHHPFAFHELSPNLSQQGGSNDYLVELESIFSRPSHSWTENRCPHQIVCPSDRASATRWPQQPLFTRREGQCFKLRYSHCSTSLQKHRTRICNQEEHAGEYPQKYKRHRQLHRASEPRAKDPLCLQRHTVYPARG